MKIKQKEIPHKIGLHGGTISGTQKTHWILFSLPRKSRKVLFLAPAEEDKTMTNKACKQPGTGAETGQHPGSKESCRRQDETLPWFETIFFSHTPIYSIFGKNGCWGRHSRGRLGKGLNVPFWKYFLISTYHLRCRRCWTISTKGHSEV